MSTMRIGASVVEKLECWFIRRRDYYASMGRLWDAVHLGRWIRGAMRFAWYATQSIAYCREDNYPFTESANLDSYITATTNGAPYLEHGAARYLQMADAAWQEAPSGSYQGLVWWTWARTGQEVGTDRYIVSKWDYGNNRRSWCMRKNGGTRFLEFGTSVDGTAEVWVTDTVAVTDYTWYFVGATWARSTPGGQVIWVGTPDMAVLRETVNPAVCQATLYNGNEELLIGAALNAGAAANIWRGYTSTVHMRFPDTGGLVLVPNSRQYLAHMFQTTKWFYEV